MGQATPTWKQQLYQDWQKFWFEPADPTLLGLIRATCGVMVVYTLFAYTFDLQAFMGVHAWLDLPTRMELVRERPNVVQALGGRESPLAPPRTLAEQKYFDAYRTEFNQIPPAPYPKNDEEMEYCHTFRRKFGRDLREYGLPPPENETQRTFVEEFVQRFRFPPSPPYPANDEEQEHIFEYTAKYHIDPNRLIAKGSPSWSLWFDVTDPGEMRLLHGIFLVISILFTLGICTRVTSALTWFAFLNYVHRAPEIQFGADTMMNIMLIYLMLGPSGAAVSLDRAIGRWWSRHKLSVINRWRRLWRLGPLQPNEIVTPTFTEQPQPSVGANLAVRLLQVHLCIIYFVAGVSKLLGNAWWNGTAVWGALANFEFAPMQYPLYNEVLRFLGHNEVVFFAFLFTGTYFTLAFEIGYAFLIWNNRFRWFYLAAAILLHGFIGVLMGLRTFALVMLVMNMAFLRPNEARWIVAKLRWLVGFPEKG